MKHAALIKDFFREIWASRSRFLSIFAIVALGVAFFSGLKAARPDMSQTALEYFSAQNLADFHIVSNLGMTKEDELAVAGLSGLESYRFGYSADLFFQNGDDALIAKTISYDSEAARLSPYYINMPSIVEGRLPERSGECAIDSNQIMGTPLSVGDEITFYLDESNGRAEDILSTLHYTVVGIVNFPEYISYTRGSSSIGNGTISSLALIPKEDYALAYYTDLYLKYTGTRGMVLGSDEYNAFHEKKEKELEAFGHVRALRRYNSFMDLSEGKLADAEAEYGEAKAEYDSTQASFDSEIAEAEGKLSRAKRDLENKKAELQRLPAKISEGEAKIAKSEKEIAQAKADVAQAKKDIAPAKEDIAELDEAIENIDAAIAAIDGYSGSGPLIIPQSVKDYAARYGDVDFSGYDNPTPEQLAQDRADLVRARSEAVSARAQLKAQVDPAEAKIAASEKKIAQAEKDLAAAKSDLAKAKTALKNGPGEVAAAEKKISEADAQLASEKADAQAKLDDAKARLEEGERELNKVKADLADISSGQWYIFDRGNNPGYSDFISDTDKLDKISSVFPFIYIFIASLVCLTTMTRMVDEQRMQIGTLKALGYSKRAIAAKYVGYALFASFTGCVVGFFIGFTLVPAAIFQSYSYLYTMPDMVIIVHWDAIFWSTLAAMAVSGFTAMQACFAELRQQAATLMRPKSPAAGKEVFLEKIPFVWSRMGFLRKVTSRNLLRYKKRFVMTLFGITGCCALLLTGFGLRHAVSSIVEKQFGQLFCYDLIGAYNPDADEQSIRSMLDAIGGIDDYSLIRQDYLTVIGPAGKNIDHYLLAAEDYSDFEGYISLRDRATGAAIPLSDDGVLITEKLSKMLKVKVGDTIDVNFDEASPVAVPVAGIVENYSVNSIYFNKTSYEKYSGRPMALNSFFANLSATAVKDSVSGAIVKNKDILNIRYAEDDKGRLRDAIGSLNYVVAIIVGAAGMLAFVVLYNLTNINVTERMRELATIKVLGFHNMEVTNYISRETTISSLLGVVLGIAAGIPMEHFVVSTSEIDAVMFDPTIDFFSFFMAAFMTLAFTLLVNFAMHFRLKKVNMAESLKAVE